MSLSHYDIFSLWLKLDKLFFGLKDDIYLYITYLPLNNSTYSRKLDVDCMDILEPLIQHFSTLCNVAILGDINARTANNRDYVCNDTVKFMPNVIPYISDNDMPNRNKSR